MALWGPDGPPEDVLGRDDFVSCPEDDGHDDACWGHVSRMKRPVAIPPPIMLLSQSEMRRIALGYEPVFDDRWLAFMEDDRLFLHPQLDRPRHLRSNLRGHRHGFRDDLGVCGR